MEVVFPVGGWQGADAICMFSVSDLMFLESLVDRGLFSNSEIALDVVHVHLCIARSTGTQTRCLQ